MVILDKVCSMISILCMITFIPKISTLMKKENDLENKKDKINEAFTTFCWEKIMKADLVMCSFLVRWMICRSIQVLFFLIYLNKIGAFFWFEVNFALFIILLKFHSFTCPTLYNHEFMTLNVLNFGEKDAERVREDS